MNHRLKVIAILGLFAFSFFKASARPRRETNLRGEQWRDREVSGSIINRTATRLNIAIDPSDPSGNTAIVNSSNARVGQKLVMGNYIGTDKQVRNSADNVNNYGSNSAVRRPSTDRRPRPRSLCTNEFIRSARSE